MDKDLNQIEQLLGELTRQKRLVGQLRRNELHYRIYFENVSDVFFSMDPDTIVTDISPSVEKVLGYKPQELIGRKFLELNILEEKHLEQALSNTLRAFEGEKISAVYQFVARDGSRKWGEVVTIPVVQEDRVTAIVSVARDITERKLFYEQLKQNGLFLNIVFESIQDGISVLNPDLTIQRVNRVMKRWYASNLPLEGKKCYAAYHDRSTPCSPCPTLRCLRTGKTEREIVPGLPGSHIEWIELLSYPMTDPNTGAISGVVQFFRDISEQKQAEEALAQSEARLRTITEASQDAIVMMDHEGAVSFWNPAAEKMFGYKAEEAIGRNIHLLLAPERYHADHKRAFVHFQQTGKGKWISNTIELMAKHRAGHEIPVELSLSRIRTDHRWRAVAIIRDVSQRKQAEAEHEELLKKLSQSQKMESIGRLAGGVAHDFNNMLGVIIGHAELALDTLNKDNPLYSSIVEILKAANHSKEITHQLLAFARSQTVSPKVLNINDAIESMLKMLRRLIGENIYLKWSPGKDTWPVYIDPSQLSQILTNLLVNARDSIEEAEGWVIIETGNETLDEEFCRKNVGFSPGQYVMLSVSDNGSGMDPKTAERIFEPFFTTKGTGKGTGLGLATVYGIVKQNKGIIDVKSKPQKGTRITIYFPRHYGQLQKSDPADRQQASGGQGATVLLVEDEQMIMEVSKSILRQLGYRVLTASTPGQALELARKHSKEIDLLITDVIMPEMNGRALADRLHALCPGLKVLFMSGYTADVITHQGVIDENVNFIQKPFSMDELAQAVRMALER